MPVPLKNVVTWTSRPPYSASRGTGAPVPNLAKVEAHQGPIPASDYQTGTTAILESDYLFAYEIGTDIKKGDTITKVSLNNPPAYTLWDELGSNEMLFVTFARNSSAGPLQHRRVYCKRVTAGGPSV